MQGSNINLAEETIQISGTNPKKCIQCGKCTATCPSEMDVKPHKVVKYLAEKNLDAFWTISGVGSLWKCLSCLACVQRCPRGVEPAHLIEAVRLTAIRPQGNNYLYPDDIPQIVENNPEIPQQLIVSAFRKYSK